MILTPSDGPEWVLQQDVMSGCPVAERVRVTARTTWPFVRKHALRELRNKRWIPDALTFISEIWEDILRATVVRIKQDPQEILDLRGYLMKAFKLRFIDAVVRANKQRNVLEFLPLPEDVEELAAVVDELWVRNLHRDLQLHELMDLMDPWTKRVWGLRQVGHSWKEIAAWIRSDARQVRLRYIYALRRLRDQIQRSRRTTREVKREK
jgi:hypothetical protein